MFTPLPLGALTVSLSTAATRFGTATNATGVSLHNGRYRRRNTCRIKNKARVRVTPNVFIYAAYLRSKTKLGLCALYCLCLEPPLLVRLHQHTLLLTAGHDGVVIELHGGGGLALVMRWWSRSNPSSSK